MEEKDTIKAYDEARYLDTEEIGSEQEDIQIMNIGFTTLTESSNITETSKHYIGMKSPTNKVTNYAKEIPFETDMIKNEKVVDCIYDIFRNEKTDTSAMRNYYSVELWNPIPEQENTYKARKKTMTVAVNEKVGDPGTELRLTGSLKSAGDTVYGTFNTTTKKFTENV